MIQANINPSFTEIYIGGGNFITENSPTNFHTFTTRKILVKNDDMSNYKEVTAAQRAALEKSDAAWTRPPQSFIDLWNKACGSCGRYNESTGFFELNGITDIGYKEALRIFTMHSEITKDLSTLAAQHTLIYDMRTFIPYDYPDINKAICNRICDCTGFEIVRFSKQKEHVVLGQCTDLFARNGKIRKWLDVIVWFGNTSFNNNKFTFAFNTWDWYTNHPFEYFRFKNVNFNIHCAFYPNIGIDSFQYLVNNRYPLTSTGANPFTVTVHSRVYAKLMDETNEEWHQLLLDATEKQIQFATT